MTDDVSKQALRDYEGEENRLRSITALLVKELELLKAKQREMHQYSNEYAKQAKKIEETEAAIKNLNKQTAEHQKITNISKGSLQQNKALLEELEKSYLELSKSHGDSAKPVKELNVQIGHLSKTIEDQEAKLKKSREVFDFHAKSVEGLESAFEDIKKDAKGTFGPEFAEALDSAASGFNAMKTGLSAVKTGFQSVGGAIKATGFGLLMLVLQSVVKYLTETADGSKMLGGALAVVKRVVDTVNGLFANLGRTIVNAVTHPLDSINKIGNFVKENLINRFKAFGVILDGIIHLDFKKIGDGVIQGATGITNATGKLVNARKAAKSYFNDLGNTYKQAANATSVIKPPRPPEKTPTSNAIPHSPKKTKPIATNAVDELKAKGTTLAQAMELDKKAFDEEMVMLNRHLEMKIISQEEYQQKSKELQSKYLQSIGKVITSFKENELEETQQHMLDLINAERIVNEGKEAKKKAWTPDQKFEAEKLRIEGQYATELANFKGTEDAKKALAEKGQQEITALTQSYEQQRRDFAMQSAQQVSDAAFSILKNGMQAQSAARLKTLDTQKSAELNNYIIIAA